MEAGGAAFGAVAGAEPVRGADDVDRGGGELDVQAGLGQAAVAGAAQAVGADRLGVEGFDAAPGRVAVLTGPQGSSADWCVRRGR